MRQKIVLLLTAFSLIMFMSPVSAHISDGHSMGMIEGLWHMLTEPSHVALLLPAIVALVFIFSRFNTRRRNQQD